MSAEVIREMHEEIKRLNAQVDGLRDNFATVLVGMRDDLAAALANRDGWRKDAKMERARLRALRADVAGLLATYDAKSREAILHTFPRLRGDDS